MQNSYSFEIWFRNQEIVITPASYPLRSLPICVKIAFLRLCWCVFISMILHFKAPPKSDALEWQKNGMIVLLLLLHHMLLAENWEFLVMGKGSISLIELYFSRNRQKKRIVICFKAVYFSEKQQHQYQTHKWIYLVDFLGVLGMSYYMQHVYAVAASNERHAVSQSFGGLFNVRRGDQQWLKHFDWEFDFLLHAGSINFNLWFTVIHIIISLSGFQTFNWYGCGVSRMCVCVCSHFWFCSSFFPLLHEFRSSFLYCWNFIFRCCCCGCLRNLRLTLTLSLCLNHNSIETTQN